ncbi:hypothetical protein ACSNOI_42045, partial [Actinomadura kijaniata]|uniref:hypothetical protein n=1 Tax=Actinomadura kijaniata TaxID=46161 RepID=UPI003F1A9CAD
THATADRSGTLDKTRLHQDLIKPVLTGTLAPAPLTADQRLSADQVAQVYTLVEAGYPLPPLVVTVESSGTSGGEPVRTVVAGHHVLAGLVRYSQPHHPDAAQARQTAQAGQAGQARGAVEVYRVLGEQGQYVAAAGPVPATWIPARALWRTLDFLACRRRLEAALTGQDAARVADLVTEAKDAGSRLLNATVAVTTFRGAGETPLRLAALTAGLYPTLSAT